jgi:murein DD-endopeptidase MepM/ murein hydrolase activator NlpD
VKKSVKTGERTAKTTAKTAKTTAKAAGKAEKVAVKTTIQTAKAAVKATITSIKAIVEGTKALISAIAAGGWVAVVIIVVICMVGLLFTFLVGGDFEHIGNGFELHEIETIQTKSTRKQTDIFAFPFEFDCAVTSNFGTRIDPFTAETAFHGGVDFGATEGTPIIAAADGVVVEANSSNIFGQGWGYFVKLDHGGGKETLYAHCSKICVAAGQNVLQGQVVGWVGNTGKSTAAHLHWEVYVEGERVNPLAWFE